MKPKELRGSEHLDFHETDTDNRKSCPLQRQILKLGISPVTSTINAMSHLLREKDKKCDNSPFRRGQEMRYLAVHEIRLREAGETYKPTRKGKENSDCISTVWELFMSNIDNRIIEAIVDQGTITDRTPQ